MEKEQADELLRAALGWHQAGRLAEAMEAYRRVLASWPRHFDAIHLLGAALRQAGRAAEAAEAIEAALGLDAAQPAAWCNLGAARQDLGQPEAALEAYERALRLKPDYPMALANSGNALRKLGRLPEAIERYRAALALQPAYPEALSNLGVALHQSENHDAARRAFEQALALKPSYADAWCGRGAALQQMGAMDEAVASYERALACAPGHAEALLNLATACQRLHRPQEALAYAERALAAQPRNAAAALQKANALRSLERAEDAVQAYRAARGLGADPQLVDYMLAALGSEPAPAAPPAQYVAALFDQYAGHFDRHLQDELAYDTPRLLVAALAPHAGAALTVIDAGCGTGLCGPLLRPFARRLIGVDLAPAMLEQARRRGCYDELACADLVGFLRETRAGLIVAADVLVYLGDLGPLMDAVDAALVPGGLFAFSVEAGAAEPFALRSSGRYAHGSASLRRLLAEHGLTVLHWESAILRCERGAGVEGMLIVARKEDNV
ncbi:MAG TPA: tetratricopeptide repeat protein [Telluria sp.]|nr:tetratricopeptide repeat protein [Telluria sp.]